MTVHHSVLSVDADDTVVHATITRSHHSSTQVVAAMTALIDELCMTDRGL
jgi:hypothetical protein